VSKNCTVLYLVTLGIFNPISKVSDTASLVNNSCSIFLSQSTTQSKDNDANITTLIALLSKYSVSCWVPARSPDTAWILRASTQQNCDARRSTEGFRKMSASATLEEFSLSEPLNHSIEKLLYYDWTSLDVEWPKLWPVRLICPPYIRIVRNRTSLAHTPLYDFYILNF
jgi:hypothetical protein